MDESENLGILLSPVGKSPNFKNGKHPKLCLNLSLMCYSDYDTNAENRAFMCRDTCAYRLFKVPEDARLSALGSILSIYSDNLFFPLTIVWHSLEERLEISQVSSCPQ